MRRINRGERVIIVMLVIVKRKEKSLVIYDKALSRGCKQAVEAVGKEIRWWYLTSQT